MILISFFSNQSLPTAFSARFRLRTRRDGELRFYLLWHIHLALFQFKHFHLTVIYRDIEQVFTSEAWTWFGLN